MWITTLFRMLKRGSSLKQYLYNFNYIEMEEMEMHKIRLIRKFNCKRKINYKMHLLMMLRVQLVYELLIMGANCLANWSLHFHLSHVYTCEFWTSENVASSNFGLALSSLLVIPYTLLLEEVKSADLVKDIQITPLALHFVACFGYNLGCTPGYVLFIAIICVLSVGLSTLLARILEGRKLHQEILHIEKEDRKNLPQNKVWGTGPMSFGMTIEEQVLELVKEEIS